MEAPLQSLYGELRIGSVLNLSSQVTVEAANSAKQLAKVIISENYAGQHGGGIGSNGDVIIGTGDLIKLTVDKTWQDNNDQAGKRPQSIKIGLYRTVEGSG